MLLGSFKSCHLDTCKVIKDEVDRIYSVIDMFLPRFSKSKVKEISFGDPYDFKLHMLT